MSPVTDRRRAARVPCRLPVRLLRGGHVTYGLSEDVSRTGLRVRVPLEDIGLAGPVDLAAVARRLDQRLGEACVAEVGWQTLGSLVRKVLRVARVAQVPDDPTAVDLGLELRVALDALECEALGLDLPAPQTQLGPWLFGPLTADDPALVAALESDERRARGPEHQPRRGVLIPKRARGRAPLRAEPKCVSERTMILALNAPERLGLPPERTDAAGLLLAFDERFGHDLDLLLLEGEEPLWAGATRVSGLEVRRGEDGMLLSVGLVEPLGPQETARLGL